MPLGIEWPDQKERFARLKEAIELIRRLWTEDFVTFEGEFFRTHNATIYDRPKSPVEMWIAASGPAAARLAGRVADGFICTQRQGHGAVYRNAAAGGRRGRREGGAVAGRRSR